MVLRYTHESGCGRCIYFTVDHSGGLLGWLKVLARFAWHRWSGQCRRWQAREAGQ
jgi:hypothetical protein